MFQQLGHSRASPEAFGDAFSELTRAGSTRRDGSTTIGGHNTNGCQDGYGTEGDEV